MCPAPAAVGGRGGVRPGVHVADHRRNVVVDDESVEANGCQPPQDARGVVVPLHDERLLEARHGALHIAEVDVEDAALRPEEIDQPVHADLAVHLRDGSQTEVHAPGRAATRQLPGPLHPLRTRQDPFDASQSEVDRRVVRMDRQLHPDVVGDGQHSVQEDLVVRQHAVPLEKTFDRLLRRQLVARKRVPVRCAIGVEGRHPRTAAPACLQVGPPHVRGQEVMAEDEDARRGHVPDGELVVLQLLLAAGLSEEDAVPVPVRHVLDALDDETGRLAPLAQADEVVDLPVATFPGEVARRVELDAGQAELLGEGRDRLVEALDMPERQPHHHRRLSPRSGRAPGRARRAGRRTGCPRSAGRGNLRAGSPCGRW